jgi:hypothetical protein
LRIEPLDLFGFAMQGYECGKRDSEVMPSVEKYYFIYLFIHALSLLRRY